MRSCLHCGTDLDLLKKNKKAIYCSIKCKQKVLTKKNYQKILEKNRNWYSKNKTGRLVSCREYYSNLSEEQLESKRRICRDSYHKNKSNGKYLVKSAARRSAKIQRSPTWLSEFDLFYIEEIYHLAKLRTLLLKQPFEVDHILPLQGRVVSGLHVPTNLQIITRLENRRKQNLVV